VEATNYGRMMTLFPTRWSPSNWINFKYFLKYFLFLFAANSSLARLCEAEF
jgi:hypothetical protein